MKKTRRILIVEDESLLSDVYSMVLSLHGFEVQVATDGLEALKKLKAFSPDIILLDLLMPKMSGITFMGKLDPEVYKTTKVIVYSNLFDADTVKKARTLGATDVILKSTLTPKQLVDRMNAYLKSI